ncbi:MAG: MFS transporter [Candidatus Rokubacteria bacterium]|nr:MFS transporter [Candidatus Rokubacteria bacterium]
MSPAALKPFRERPEARRLALIFAVVYFAQGMWYLPNLSITFLLKDTLGLSAAQTAAFFSITVIPWLVKPVYGLVSDFLPLFGRRRKSYFLLTSGLAAAMGFTLGMMPSHTYWGVAVFFTLMGFGLAFTDVLTDAMMVENGQRLGLTGTFQAVQWAAISVASMLVGIGGGWLAQHKPLQVTFMIAMVFPAISFCMAVWAIREPRVEAGGQRFRETWLAIRGTLGSRPLWIVAGFIFFYNFSPSFGPALTYYSTDVLRFSKLFLGTLDSLLYASGAVGAALYFALCRSIPFNRLIHFAIGGGVTATLAYLGYVGPVSAVAIALIFGAVGMIIQLTILDLAAKACPKQAEGTFFALLMSVFNGAVQVGQISGGWLYDQLGFTNLILISAAFTALCWLLVPLLNARQYDAARQAPEAVPASG